MTEEPRVILITGTRKGIGRHLAHELVAAFGERVFDVIEQVPARLTEIKGIGPRRNALIVANWAEQKTVRGLMVFLQSHGVGTARALRIYRTYGWGDYEMQLMKWWLRPSPTPELL